jgi:hypothetical protein
LLPDTPVEVPLDTPGEPLAAAPAEPPPPPPACASAKVLDRANAVASAIVLIFIGISSWLRGK